MCEIILANARFEARGSGALWWPEMRTLVVADLHLGKSERQARRWGRMLPPYEVRDTLDRLEAEIDSLAPARVICLGDSFDDDHATDGLGAGLLRIRDFQSGREWVWVTGNHDPGSVALGGETVSDLQVRGITFVHIGDATRCLEISGHYHPKALIALRGKAISKPCFLCDAARIVMPAFGTYTGGLDCREPVLANLMFDDARAILTGRRPHAIPIPGRRRA